MIAIRCLFISDGLLPSLVMEHFGSCNQRAVTWVLVALRLTQKGGCPRFLAGLLINKIKARAWLFFINKGANQVTPILIPLWVATDQVADLKVLV